MSVCRSLFQSVPMTGKRDKTTYPTWRSLGLSCLCNLCWERRSHIVCSLWFRFLSVCNNWTERHKLRATLAVLTSNWSTCCSERKKGKKMESVSARRNEPVFPGNQSMSKEEQTKIESQRWVVEILREVKKRQQWKYYETNCILYSLVKHTGGYCSTCHTGEK